MKENHATIIFINWLSLQIAGWDNKKYVYHMYISTELTPLEIHLQGARKYPQISQSPIWSTWHLNGFHVKKTKKTVRLGEGYRSSTQLQEAQGGGEGWFEGFFLWISFVGSEEDSSRGPILFLLKVLS